ncbi:hypothetical protein L249_1921 [Ophiocordyceps polyrhachis-furcata BCC 54312]|uniref:Uncharacterized protein n=1 Tax=Ophiocordyceps polyrhachis-furcata BCC 54312 TaxID=1330021 RepID=A0A367LQL9_9HYPO|nr:hypothetical protein L249_1921 [Ophiocordyceps polyrhachis-furcata BCC 54312]
MAPPGSRDPVPMVYGLASSRVGFQGLTLNTAEMRATALILPFLTIAFALPADEDPGTGPAQPPNVEEEYWYFKNVTVSGLELEHAIRLRDGINGCQRHIRGYDCMTADHKLVLATDTTFKTIHECIKECDKTIASNTRKDREEKMRLRLEQEKRNRDGLPSCIERNDGTWGCLHPDWFLTNRFEDRPACINFCQDQDTINRQAQELEVEREQRLRAIERLSHCKKGKTEDVTRWYCWVFDRRIYSPGIRRIRSSFDDADACIKHCSNIGNEEPTNGR